MSSTKAPCAYAVAITTLGNKTSAARMARGLVASGLAACAQVSPVCSYFLWEDAEREEQEFRIELKIRVEDYPALEQEILRLHPYDTPEILCIPIIQGFAPYLAWIEQAAHK